MALYGYITTCESGDIILFVFDNKELPTWVETMKWVHETKCPSGPLDGVEIVEKFTAYTFHSKGIHKKSPFANKDWEVWFPVEGEHLQDMPVAECDTTLRVRPACIIMEAIHEYYHLSAFISDDDIERMLPDPLEQLSEV